MSVPQLCLDKRTAVHIDEVSTPPRTCLPAYLPTYVPTLPTYPPSPCLPTYLRTYVPIFSRFTHAGKAPKAVDEAPKFVPFAGGGARLDGKKTPPKSMEEEGKEGKGSSDGATRKCAWQHQFVALFVLLFFCVCAFSHFFFAPPCCVYFFYYLAHNKMSSDFVVLRRR